MASHRPRSAHESLANARKEIVEARTKLQKVLQLLFEHHKDMHAIDTAASVRVHIALR